MSFPKFLLYTFNETSAKASYFEAQTSVIYFTPSRLAGSDLASTSDIEFESANNLS